MTRLSPRRILAVICATGIAAATLSVALGGSAGAEAPAATRVQVATPPPPGSGVRITIVNPLPLGPLSFT